jgi:alkylation response protein AidB-like acyl-CoA dehydrogenase
MSTQKRPVITFSEEQEQLLDIATNFCRDKSPIAAVRDQMKEEQSHKSEVWQEIAELGWLGVAVPEEFGGIGLSLAEVVTLAEPMGQYLLSTPFVPTTLAAQALLAGGTKAQKETWLPKLCEGAIGTLALSEPHGDWDLTNLTCTATGDGTSLNLSGTKTGVNEAALAEVILVSVLLDGAPALVILTKTELPDGALRREVSIDETRRTFTLTLDGISVSEEQLLDLSKATSCLARIDKVGALLIAAEMCGGTSAALDYVIEYLNTRKQFERLIGSYQALKHPTVDILTELEAARSHLYYAACVFDDPAEGDVAVRMAKAQAGDALSYAGDRAIQFHGGFGFTYDCDAQLYRRRAIWGQAQFGDSAHHRKHLADALLN